MAEAKAKQLAKDDILEAIKGMSVLDLFRAGKGA